MKFIIKETRELKNLNVCDFNGIDYTQDLIGNTGDIKNWEYDENQECYIIPKDTFDWWADYITNQNSDNQKLHELKKQYNTDEIQEIINEEFSNCSDYNAEHDIMQTVFDRIESELVKIG